MFGVDFLNPYVLKICNAGFSPDLTSLSHAPTRGYGLRIVTTRANSKRFKKLRRRGTLVASPCPARSTRCHPKHGLARTARVRSLIRRGDGEHQGENLAQRREQEDHE